MKLELNLEELIRHTVDCFHALSEEEQSAHWREQKVGFAYGNLTCTGRRDYITRDMIEREYDKRWPKKLAKELEQEDM